MQLNENDMSWGDNLAALDTARLAGQMVGQAEAQARHYKSAAEKWKAHAEQMKADLEKVWDMYIQRTAQKEAQADLKDAALKEIEKLDPLNKMLNSAYRQKIYEEGYRRAMEEQKK